MSIVRALPGGFLLLVLLGSVAGSHAQERPPPPVGPHPGFAVVELYTSQGCSSCPPADAVLRRLDAWARANDHRVFSLSFHVTYWNRLGWRDPFSQAAFTERQHDYADLFDRRNVFTPEAVINGRISQNGSHETSMRQRVEAALARGALARVSLSAEAIEGGVRVEHEVEDAPPGSRLWLALVERGLSSEVTRGENRGRRLHHDNVVRHQRSAALLNGSTTLPLESRAGPRRVSVVAFLQHHRRGTVLGAERVDLLAR